MLFYEIRLLLRQKPREKSEQRRVVFQNRGEAFDELLRSGRDFAAEGYSPLEWGVFLTIRSRSGRIVRRMQVN